MTGVGSGGRTIAVSCNACTSVGSNRVVVVVVDRARTRIFSSQR
jgi:hypothetical protein